jgi:transcription elongation factor GreA
MTTKSQSMKIIQTIPFTKSGYNDLKVEKEKLLHDRPEAVLSLKTARDMGDLSENAAYRAARQKLSAMDSRLRRLDMLLRLGRVIESNQSGIITIGSKVTVQHDNQTIIYTITGSFESDPSKGSISYISPLGKMLIGKSVGDTITVQTPSGKTKYTIERLV